MSMGRLLLRGMKRRRECLRGSWPCAGCCPGGSVGAVVAIADVGVVAEAAVVTGLAVLGEVEIAGAAVEIAVAVMLAETAYVLEVVSAPVDAGRLHLVAGLGCPSHS